ncbi:SMP-30/gluconolactonase/LRE family protein [Nocardia sp. NBC_00511]|uniref:SMP-30/gluconolactonase/LRE family protein n=1 Tax=Nocardia sp. NBC_00511 TaxID=2903591 RepID=UPI0030E02BEB
MPDPRPEAVVRQSDSRVRRWAGLGVACALAATAVAQLPVTAEAAPPACAPAKSAIALPTRAPLLDWSENLGFDAAGDLWVARIYRNAVERYDRDGHLVSSVPVTSPGAIRLGPDGLLYVTFGNTPLSAATHQGGVVRFDPTAATPRPEVFATGLGQANGAAFDAAGNLYVADTSSGVERIRRDGTVDTDWTTRAEQALAAQGPGADGIVAVGDTLYVTLLESPTGRIVALPIDDPTQASVAIELGGSALGPDDLTVGRNGILYVATVTGQLVRVDPLEHTSCVVLSGQPITSVAVNPADDLTLLIGSEGGDVVKAHVHED